MRQDNSLSPFFFAAEGLNVLMKDVIEYNLFTGYNIGTQESSANSHLEFVDDTLLVGAKSWAIVIAVWVVLLLFEGLSGLKVNFQKKYVGWC